MRKRRVHVQLQLREHPPACGPPEYMARAFAFCLLGLALCVDGFRVQGVGFGVERHVHVQLQFEHPLVGAKDSRFEI